MIESTATAPIVDVHQLRKIYRSLSLTGRRQIEAVRGVSLQAFPGEVFGLLGPNGAGKTTLIKMLLGVVKPTSGEAKLFDQPIGSSTARARVGYLPESLRVDLHHTARSALRYYGRMSRMSEVEITRQSDRLLELVGLDGRDRESVRRFSKGMYQRLGLAQALMHDPDLLVLDEPTDGLDPVGRNEVRKVIDRLRDSGKTIFLNSHILQEVELVCSRVAILAKGEIRAIGRIDELTHSDDQWLLVQTPINPEHPSGAEAIDWANILPNRRAESDQSENELGVTSTIKGHCHQWSVPVKGQSEIDSVVDGLRRAGQSIVRLEVRRESLEESFMRLVGQPEEMSQ